MRFLIIDDAPDIVEAVSLCLEIRYPGCAVLSAGEGKPGLELALKESPDLVILDIGLPDSDGFEICRQIRAMSRVPIIMLTVRGGDMDVARGLASGADDYITKPFSHIGLLARVQSVLRRAGPAKGSARVLTAGDLSLNSYTREVWLKRKQVRLTVKEFNILYELVLNGKKVLSHRELVIKVWGPESVTKVNYLKVHIQHLRQKLGDSASCPRYIGTESGVGYWFMIPVQEAKSSQ